MKQHYFLILFLILLSNFTGCKETTEKVAKRDVASCETGIEKAIQDANNGKYKLLSYGLVNYDDLQFQIFYERYVEKRYGIKIGNGGCKVYEESECYSNKMQELIFNKFGKDIFEKAQAKAKIEYKIDIQNKINNDYIFSIVDSMPTYKYDQERLTSYLTENIKNNRNLEGRVLVFFVIEKNGEVTNVEIKKSFDKEYDKTIIKTFVNMPLWNSGIHHGEKVRVKFAIPLVFKNNAN